MDPIAQESTCFNCKQIVFGAYEKMFGVHLYYFLRNPNKLPTCILLRNVLKKLTKNMYLE